MIYYNIMMGLVKKTKLMIILLKFKNIKISYFQNFETLVRIRYHFFRVWKFLVFSSKF